MLITLKLPYYPSKIWIIPTLLRSRLVLVAEVDSQLLGGHTDEAVWVHLPVVEFMVAGFLGP